MAKQQEHYLTAITATSEYYVVAGCRCGWVYQSYNTRKTLDTAMKKHIRESR